MDQAALQALLASLAGGPRAGAMTIGWDPIG